MELVLDRPLVSWNYLQSLTGLDKADLIAASEISGRLYKPFDLRRRGTTKWRHIDNPVERLAEMQRSLQRGLFRRLELPETVVGGVPGKSTRHAAQPHVAKSTLVTLDLRNCFPRTSNRKVYAALRRHLGASPEIAATLTKLVTLHRRVPQGAPTSPAIANLCLLDLHAEVASICDGFGLDYSFYVDDIAISGDRADKAIEPVIRAIQKDGHAVRSPKKKILRSDGRQAVTGIVVNRDLSAGRSRIEEVRAEVLHLSASLDPSEADLLRVRGRIASIATINQAQGAVLRALAERVLPTHGRPSEKARKDEYRDCPPCLAS